MLSFGQMGIFSPKIAHLDKSRCTVSIFLNFAQWKEPIGR